MEEKDVLRGVFYGKVYDTHFCCGWNKESLEKSKSKEIPLVRRSDVERADYLQEQWTNQYLKLQKIKKLVNSKTWNDQLLAFEIAHILDEED